MGSGRAAIGIMCKPPRPGVSKTRLAAEIGAEAAARLSAAFLQDVAAAALAGARPSGAAVYALYAPENAGEELRTLLPPGLHYMAQRGSDLGHTMHRALGELLAMGHSGAILIGADLPTLPPALVTQAAEQLETHAEQLVLGPAQDGGYYLIGMTRAHPQLFTGIAWSTPEVLGATLDRARGSGLPVHLLPAWLDVDDGPSLARLIAELGGEADLPLPPGPAAYTRLALSQIEECGRIAARGI